MAWKLNPFTGELDYSGGGASYIDGVVADSSLLPTTLGSPALDAVYLAKAGSGVWLINRKPAGLYVRTANNGDAADWTYLGAFPEVNADGNWELYNSTDPTKELKFDLSGISASTTRTLTAPDASGTIALTSDLTGGVGGSTSTDNAIIRADSTADTVQESSLLLDDPDTSTQANVAIVNAHSGETNSALVLTPKGNGAFIVGPKPDGTSTGGNARGNYAVDIQTERNSNFRVASGEGSVAVGMRNTSSGTYASCLGYNNVANNSYAVALGGSCQATALAAFAAGYVNAASVRQSVALGGAAIANRALIAYCSHSNSAPSHRQALFGLMTQTTTDATPQEMMCDQASNSRLTVQSGKIISGIVTVCGSKSDGSAAVLMSRDFLVKNVSGTTTLLSSNTVGTDFLDSTTAACSVLANDTNDSVAVTVTGIAGETWRWSAVFQASEHYYGT